MKSGVIRAIRTWKNLESLTMPSVANLAHFLTEIAKNCKNFKELKIMSPFDMVFANALVTCLPNVKILSLRCSAIREEALVKVLQKLPGLEMLNISHSYLVKENVIVRILDEKIVGKTSRLKNFHCMNVETCVLCQRPEEDEGNGRWLYLEKNECKFDEIKSLHL